MNVYANSALASVYCNCNEIKYGLTIQVEVVLVEWELA